MSKLTDDLRAIATFFDEGFSPRETDTKRIREAADLIDRLYKTADGVPICRDDTVWLTGSGCDSFAVTVVNEIVIRYPDGELSRHHPGWTHSTYEAAEKARAE